MRSSFRLFATSAFGRTQPAAPIPASVVSNLSDRSYAAASRLTPDEEEDFSKWRHFNKRLKRSRRHFVRSLEWSDSDDEDCRPLPPVTNRLQYPKFKPHKVFQTRHSPHMHPRRPAATPRAQRHGQGVAAASEYRALKHRSCHRTEEQTHSCLHRPGPPTATKAQHHAAAMSTVAYGVPLTVSSLWTPLSSEDLAGILPSESSPSRSDSDAAARRIPAQQLGSEAADATSSCGDSSRATQNTLAAGQPRRVWVGAGDADCTENESPDVRHGRYFKVEMPERRVNFKAAGRGGSAKVRAAKAHTDHWGEWGRWRDRRHDASSRKGTSPSRAGQKGPPRNGGPATSAAGKKHAKHKGKPAGESAGFVPRFKVCTPGWAAMRAHERVFADAGGSWYRHTACGGAKPGRYGANRHSHPGQGGHEGAGGAGQQCWFTFDDHTDFEYAFRSPRYDSSRGASAWANQRSREHAWHAGAAAGRRTGPQHASAAAAPVDGVSRQHLQTLELSAVPQTASGLKSAYLRAAKKHHPDASGVGGGGATGAHRFHAVQSAYEHLKATLVLP